MTPRIEEVLKERNIDFLTDVSAKTLSTFRIGGIVKTLILPKCVSELEEAIALCRACGNDFAVIGGGSNVLFGDGAIDVAVISTRRLDAVRVRDETIFAECGVFLGKLARFAAENGLCGLEFAAGIPGTLGGAVFMNAGAFGGEIGALVRSVPVFLPEENKIRRFSREEAGFAYRESVFQHTDAIVLGAELTLAHGDPAKIARNVAEFARRRKATQPQGEPSAGSVFRRPAPGYPLARVLDELGVKGWREGGAAVSEKHAGFIVNRGGATARDVKKLIGRIQNHIEKEKGFRPQTEIRSIPREK